MADIAERFRGIDGDQDQRVIQYLVTDATDDQDALNLAEAAAPITYDLMPRQNIRVIEVDKKAFANREYSPGLFIEEQDPNVADGTYYLEALYSRRRGTQPVEETDKKPDPTDTEGNHDTYAFEQTLETIRIRESGNATDRYTPGGAGSPNPTDAIKLNGINVQPDGTVEGADIRSPIGSFSYDYYPDKSNVDQAYLDAVQDAVGSTNSLVFFGRQPGEVLFIGATGRKRNLTDWEFNFRFEFRPNAVGLTVGEGSFEIIYAKLGHQYIWTYYDEVKETTASGEERSILVPRQVNVETIYPSADLQTILFPP